MSSRRVKRSAPTSSPRKRRRARRARPPSAVAKAGFPTIEVAGAYARRLQVTDRPSALQTTRHAIGVNLRIPDLHRLQADLCHAPGGGASPSRRRRRAITLYRQTELDVWQAYYDVQTVDERHRQHGGAGEDPPSRRREATLARYQAGFGTILDLITAQQDESNARVQRIQSYLDWYTALARLNLALGASNLIAADPRRNNETTLDDCWYSACSPRVAGGGYWYWQQPGPKRRRRRGQGRRQGQGQGQERRRADHRKRRARRSGSRCRWSSTRSARSNPSTASRCARR